MPLVRRLDKAFAGKYRAGKLKAQLYDRLVSKCMRNP